MKKLLFLLLSYLLVFTTNVFSQCTFSTAFGSGNAPAAGSSVTLSTCVWAGERSQLNNVVAGVVYTVSSNVTTSWFTVRSGTWNGPVVAFGQSTLTWTATVAGTYFIHTSTNSFCGTATGCRSVVVTRPAPCSGTLVTLNMTDTWGDGWNGAEFRLQEAGGTIYGPYTLPSGSSGTQNICLPNGCYRVILTAGSWPGEIGWSITNGATTIVSAAAPNAAPFNTQFTIGGTSCPAAPSNNLCANAPVIDLSTNPNQTHSGTGVGSTNTLGLSQFSQTWVRIVVPCGGMNVSMNFCGTTPTRNNAYINLLSNCSSNPTLTQASNWNLTNCTNGSITLNWNNVPAGTYYYPILIDNIAWPGAYSLNIVGTPLINLAITPTSISGDTTIFINDSTTLTLQGGSPGTNGIPQWFDGSCGGTLIGTGNSITVSPSSNTTYFVRYSGPCNTTDCVDVTVEIQSVLPVELSSFTFTCDPVHTLNWTTESEQNSDYFQIERSRDGFDWIEVSKVEAMGNSNTTKNYQFYDMTSGYFEGYYRLKQVDFDGKFEYFGPVSSFCSDYKDEFISEVFPNPTSGEIFVGIRNNIQENVNMVLTDFSGRVLKDMTFEVSNGYTLKTIDLLGYSSGSYLITIITNNNKYVHKITLK
jgi:hypothetical protein